MKTPKERCHLFPTLKVSLAFIAMTYSLHAKLKILFIIRKIMTKINNIPWCFEEQMGKSGSRPKSSPSEGRLLVRVTHHFIEEERVYIYFRLTVKCGWNS